MSILVKCECGAEHRLRDEHAGKLAKCGQCGAMLRIPSHVSIDDVFSDDPASPEATSPDQELPAPTPGQAQAATLMNALPDTSWSTPPQPVPPRPSTWSPSTSPAAPVSVPAPPATDRSTALLIGGFAIGAATSIAVGLLSPSGSVLGTLFSPTRFEGLVPAAILGLFLAGALLCHARLRRLRDLRQQCAPENLRPLLGALRDGGLPATRTFTTAAAQGPLQRRANAVLEQWQTAPGLQEADVVLQQHVAHDEDAVQDAYSLVRLFVWALPVLGLIGTVIGISLAVGGFANFLSGSIDDVAEIKKSLVSVTSGLSFAFLITLLGLATSLLLMFASSMLQSSEMRLLGRVQQAIADGLLPALQAAAPVPQQQAQQNPGTELLSAWRSSLQESAAAVMATVQRTAEQLLHRTRDQLQQQQKAAEQIGAEFARHAQTSATHLGSALESAVGGVSRLAEQLNARASELHQAIAQEREAVSQLARQNGDAASGAAERLRQTIDQQSQAIAGSVAAIERLASATAAVRESQSSALQAVAALGSSESMQKIASLVEALQGNLHEIRQASATFGQLAHSTDALVNAHQGLRASTQQLHEVGLPATLASVRDSLTSVVPVLQAFGKPFVLQAVPVAAGLPEPTTRRAPDGDGQSRLEPAPA